MQDHLVSDAIDPHIHLFDLRGTPRPTQPLGRLFGWNERVLRFMASKLMPGATLAFFGRDTPLLGDYLPPNYRADSELSKVASYVHIQAGWTHKKPLDPVGETAWLNELEDGPSAIVGYADLSLGQDVGQVLDAHRSASDKFRGIRHMLSWHPSAGVMNFADDEAISSAAAFRAGYDQLAERGLSFDAWCYGDQLDEVTALAAHNSKVPMVLCHVGSPVGIFGPFAGIGETVQERDRIASKWRDDIASLADQRHVLCKLSGLLMPVLGTPPGATEPPSIDELVDRLGPVVAHCIDTFGVDRCMVGSNFPVDGVAITYAAMHESMHQLTRQYGAPAQRALFRDNAAQFYRIETTQPI